MKKRILIEIPGFSHRLLPWARGLHEWAQKNNCLNFQPSIPALTLPAHASLLTGAEAEEHGVYANGSYYRDSNKVEMWPQSEAIIKGTLIWDHARDQKKDFRCFKYFWWPGMNSSATVYGNVRPVYHADGRKSPGIYMNKPGLADTLQKKYGTFPLFRFWGPATDITSTQWILDTATYCLAQEDFDLSLIYLPHLDYKQQSHGPYHRDIEKEVHDLDKALMAFINAHCDEYEFILLSSYHIAEVDTPIHINKILRQENLLNVIQNEAGETIDYGESIAFSVSDHQIAQIYIQDLSYKEKVIDVLQSIKGIDTIKTLSRIHTNTPDIICYAQKNAWFTYYYWLEEKNAPDFARTVAIHDKCGYDPCELLIDPAIPFPAWRIAQTLALKKLGFRTTMKLTPLDAHLIKGSHGLPPQKKEDYPIFLHNTQQHWEKYVRIQDIKANTIYYAGSR